jgi:4a-hydroxytetrahydrobiopterin dehydratase
MTLISRHCSTCDSSTQKLSEAKQQEFLKELGPEWRIVDGQRLTREFKFKNFADALAFTNKIGAMAEEENHHPDIYLTWGKVRVEISTHSAGGLTENDFVLAAKI